jgi:hypothetical protein
VGNQVQVPAVRVARGVAAPVRPGPVFVPAPARRIGPRQVGLAAGGVVLGTLVSLLRQVGVPATDTMWAEDASLFLSDAVLEPLPRAVFGSYNGYFLLPPRMLAEVIAWLPSAWAAPSLAITAAAVNSLLALVVYVASAAALRSPVLRGTVAAVAVVTPVGGYEVPNSLANVQWAALYALFWVALWVPASRAGQVVEVVTGLAVATTSILAIAFLPLLGVRWLHRRDRTSGWLAGTVLAGIGLQLAGLLFGASHRDGVKIDLGGAFSLFYERFLPMAVGGDQLVGVIREPVRDELAVILAWSAVGLVGLVAALRWRAANWAVAGLALLHSLLIWLATAGVTAEPPTRYTTTPAMLVVSALAALLVPASARVPAPAAHSGGSAPVGVPAVVFALLVGLVCVANLRGVNGREAGPSWSAGLDQARATCATLGSDARVLVPISPAGWRARLPCWYLRR